jgi:hypothetical protein
MGGVDAVPELVTKVQHTCLPIEFNVQAEIAQAGEAAMMGQHGGAHTTRRWERP